jgi:hypothetical protein
MFVTLAATETHTAFAISGPLEIQHRWGKLSALGINDGLISACTQALQNLTDSRVAKYARAHVDYVAAQAAIEDEEPASEVQPLVVTLRSDSGELIDAATYIAGLDSSSIPEGILRDFSKQLRRPDIDVRWVLLPKRSAEIAALERWAQMFCIPGRAVTCDGPSRSSYRIISQSFENLDINREVLKGSEDMVEAPFEMEELAA